MDKSSAIQRRKEKFRKQMKVWSTILLVVLIAASAVLAYNLKRIHDSDTGSGSTLASSESGSKYTNSYYTIGNNPTEVDKEYFLELNKAVEEEDQAAIATAAVKCFVTEYYTWTNKDGTYDIGGMQYIFTDRQSDFESYTRNEVYKDMDKYISQLGTENLMQVASVEAEEAQPAEAFQVYSEAEATADPYSEATATPQTSVSYDAYTVQASWTYETDTKMDLSEAQTSAVFTVINHNGRMEIAAIQ